jgi:hypothetical protein
MGDIQGGFSPLVRMRVPREFFTRIAGKKFLGAVEEEEEG